MTKSYCFLSMYHLWISASSGLHWKRMTLSMASSCCKYLLSFMVLYIFNLEAYAQVSAMIKQHRVFPPSRIDQYCVSARYGCWNLSHSTCRYKVLYEARLPGVELCGAGFDLKYVILRLPLGPDLRKERHTSRIQTFPEEIGPSPYNPRDNY